jgi:hypothetical protein
MWLQAYPFIPKVCDSNILLYDCLKHVHSGMRKNAAMKTDGITFRSVIPTRLNRYIDYKELEKPSISELQKCNSVSSLSRGLC